MASSGILRSVALVRTDVSEKLSASIIRVTREQGIEIQDTVRDGERRLSKSYYELIENA
jgi:hypothetical protein